jgi:hypothetical protein
MAARRLFRDLVPGVTSCDRQSSCAGKESYAQKQDAVHVVSRRRARRKLTGQVNIYRCRWCGSWHIGRSPVHERQMAR